MPKIGKILWEGFPDCWHHSKALIKIFACHSMEASFDATPTSWLWFNIWILLNEISPIPSILSRCITWWQPNLSNRPVWCLVDPPVQGGNSLFYGFICCVAESEHLVIKNDPNSSRLSVSLPIRYRRNVVWRKITIAWIDVTFAIDFD